MYFFGTGTFIHINSADYYAEYAPYYNTKNTPKKQIN